MPLSFPPAGRIKAKPFCFSREGQLSLLLHFCKFAFLHLHFDKMGKAENGRRNSNYHYKANFRGGMLSVKDKITIFASDIRRKL
jgi:hypothetical protein